jgi:nucleoside-diphosphate-sugar epimerase
LGKAYNIGNDLPLSQREFLSALAREIGARPPRLQVPYRVLYSVASVAERLAELTRSKREPVVTRHGVNLFGTDNRHAIDKAERELGYTPQVPLTKGIRLAAAWYEQGASAPRG